MGFFDDDDDAFDFFVFQDLDRMNKKGGGCLMSILAVLIIPALIFVNAILS